MLIRQFATILTLAALAGCNINDSNSASRPQPITDNPKDNRAEIAASWSSYIAGAHSRIGDAQSHFQERWKNGEGSLQVEIVSDDVHETSSLKYSAEGEIAINSTQRFGGITTKHFRHKLRFGLDNGKWSFIGGSGTGPEGNFDYPEMTASWQRVMFP